MSQQRIERRVHRGLAWIGVASSLVAALDLVAFVVILNVWVSKAEYGVATMCLWIFPILDQVTDLGLSSAVIQRDDHSDAKISTVFWINVGMASVLFLLLALFAPIVTARIGYPIVGWMLVAYGTKLLFQNVYFIPVAMMKRELRFKELSVIRVISNVAELAGKIGFAAAGFGIWCFVLGPLCRVLVAGIGAQVCHPWRPKLILRPRDAKDYLSFGLKASGSQILFSFYTNIDYPIVGAFFGKEALGLYKIAYEVVLEPVRLISNVVVDIAFPTFARLRHTPERLIGQFVSFMRLNLITVMSYSAIVLIAAEDVVRVVLPASVGIEPAVRMLSIVAVLRSMSFVVPPLLDGVGHPERTFKYTLTAAIALPIAYLAGASLLGPSLGFVSVAVAWAVGYPIAFAVLVYLATATLGWSIGAFARSIAGVAGCLAASAAVAVVAHALIPGVPAWVRLAVTSGVVVVVSGVLLAYTQGISLRSAKRALAGQADGPPR